MHLRILQAVGVTFALGAVAFVATAPATAPVAQAATVRPAVGKPLQAAQSLLRQRKAA